MKLFKKILGIFVGMIIIGFGVAFSKAASLGQDPFAAFIFSLVYLFDEKIPYSVWYIIINGILFIFMLFFLRKKINIGTITGIIFIGLFCDIAYEIFVKINIIPTYFGSRVIFTILGIVICCIGIALYGSANLGLGPYDAISVIVSRKFKYIKFKYARIMLDTTCTMIAFIVGFLILKRSDIVNINTIITFIIAGPLISVFSNIFVKYYYKDENSDFN